MRSTGRHSRAAFINHKVCTPETGPVLHTVRKTEFEEVWPESSTVETEVGAARDGRADSILRRGFWSAPQAKYRMPHGIIRAAWPTSESFPVNPPGDNQTDGPFDVICRRRIHADQDDDAFSHPFPSLDCNLPEMAVQPEKNPAFGLGPSGTCPSPVVGKSVPTHNTSSLVRRGYSTTRRGKFSSARSRIYAGINTHRHLCRERKALNPRAR